MLAGPAAVYCGCCIVSERETSLSVRRSQCQSHIFIVIYTLTASLWRLMLLLQYYHVSRAVCRRWCLRRSPAQPSASSSVACNCFTSLCNSVKLVLMCLCANGVAQRWKYNCLYEQFWRVETKMYSSTVYNVEYRMYTLVQCWVNVYTVLKQNPSILANAMQLWPHCWLICQIQHSCSVDGLSTAKSNQTSHDLSDVTVWRTQLTFCYVTSDDHKVFVYTSLSVYIYVNAVIWHSL